MESTERVIRYVCTREAHVSAPSAMGYATEHGFAWAWCPSIEAVGHEWIEIKDMRSRMTDLDDVMDVLRGSSAERRESSGWR